jgi:hypothetical protein
MPELYDTVFSLPSVDDDPGTEIGVLFMGLGPERLLAGLGVASERELDPATTTMYVDQLRHGARPEETIHDALAAGAARWRVAVRGFASAGLDQGPPSAALRQQWDRAAEAIAAAAREVPELRTTGAAERVYLVACWLRRDEIARTAEENVVLPELPS